MLEHCLIALLAILSPLLMLAVVRELAMTAAETGSLGPPPRARGRSAPQHMAPSAPAEADDAAQQLRALLDELRSERAAVATLQQKLAATQESELLDELARRVKPTLPAASAASPAPLENTLRPRPRAPPADASGPSAGATLVRGLRALDAALSAPQPHEAPRRTFSSVAGTGGAVGGAAADSTQAAVTAVHDATVALKEAAQTLQRATQALIAHTGGQPAAATKQIDAAAAAAQQQQRLSAATEKAAAAAAASAAADERERRAAERVVEATKKLDAAKAAAKAAGFTTEVPVSNDEEQLVAAAAAALLGAMTGKPELGKLEAAADAVATAAKATKTPPPDEFEVRTLSGEEMAALKEAFAGATGSKAAGAAAAKEAAKLVEVAATELGGTAPTGGAAAAGAAAAGAAAAAERKKAERKKAEAASKSWEEEWEAEDAKELELLDAIELAKTQKPVSIMDLLAKMTGQDADGAAKKAAKKKRKKTKANKAAAGDDDEFTVEDVD